MVRLRDNVGNYEIQHFLKAKLLLLRNTSPWHNMVWLRGRDQNDHTNRNQGDYCWLFPRYKQPWGMDKDQVKKEFISDPAWSHLGVELIIRCC